MDAKAQSKQVRIGFDIAREIEIEAAVQGVTIKSLIERLWVERKTKERPLFPMISGVEFTSETAGYMRLVASVLSRSEDDRDRAWLIGSLDLLLDKVKLFSQGSGRD